MAAPEIVGKALKPADDFKLSPGLVVPIIAGFFLFFAFSTFLPITIVTDGLAFVWKHLSVWLMLAFGYLFYYQWMAYVQTKEFFSLEKVLLEIKLPEEITQSPAAMEAALHAFYYTGEPEHEYDKYILGRTRPQFSLEIVSFEGDIRFYIMTRKKTQNVIEAELYSHYPTIEIQEVPDYMPNLPYDTEQYQLWGLYKKLQKPDPYPIKTYVDYGLDSEQKEEFKVDPLNGVLEFFGSFGKGEYGFVQIIIRSHQAEKPVPGKWFKKESWVEEGVREKEKIIKDIREEKDGSISFRVFTEGEKRTIESLERNTGKKPFDVGMRTMYMAQKEHYRSERHAGMPTIFRPFESEGSNGLKPIFLGITYPWEDFFGTKRKLRLQELYTGYRRRSILTPPNDAPYAGIPFVLSTEELATLYHFPGRVAQTPTLGRIGSRKEEAPPDLPR